MPASLQKFSDDRKIDSSHERPIQCPYCSQQYLLTWDDAEWNSVKDWIRVAEGAVRRSAFFVRNAQRGQRCPEGIRMRVAI